MAQIVFPYYPFRARVHKALGLLGPSGRSAASKILLTSLLTRLVLLIFYSLRLHVNLSISLLSFDSHANATVGLSAEGIFIYNQPLPPSSF
ncbi:hypothetical protein CEXT_67701 [Caerostris extrusa]|uniref:Uncharacterized protein n=1 Tax=Caerostris extrusa TaxID=172846 RepID=A0AAV4SM70_CAEEX|nr:hypothetical protein CEXT_67701 [Caerostris extrusa]